MKKCEWYDKELEGVAWNYPLCCSQHTKDSQKEMRESYDKAMMEALVTSSDAFDDFEAVTRVFVSDYPIWKRFFIWLFPRMYDLRYYP